LALIVLFVRSHLFPTLRDRRFSAILSAEASCLRRMAWV